jgi:hypothetical protein
MAFTANNHLTPDTKTTLKDYQHAAKLFVPDQFRLAPKHNFLFHVAFSINPNALRNTNLTQRYSNEINMLVKGIDLPSFKVSTEVLNQYNRKKVMQFTHAPGEIKVKFHDDNMGLINQLWQNYYSYYYADSLSANTNGAYNRNAMRNSNFIKAPFGLDAGSSTPFFNYITVYQMARHEFVSYKLINPIITNWNHNKLDYSEVKTHEFDMSIAYESVAYGMGAVGAGSPEGFALTHYDTTPSPLHGTNPDPTVSDPSFVKSLDTEGLSAGILNNAVNTVNTYQNTSDGGGGIMSTLGTIGGVVAAGAGIAAAFPGAASAIGGAIEGGIEAVSSGFKGAVDFVSDLF